MINTMQLHGEWNKKKGILKQRFAVLTDDDLLFKEGEKDEMYGKIQVKLGITKDELMKIINEL